MPTMGHDLRYAIRSLRRSPGFAAIAILSLGLGTGVNTAMFSLVDAVLFRPLPVAAPEQLVDVFTSGGDGDEYATSSYPDFLDLKAANTVFSDMTAYSMALAPLNLGDRSRLAMGHLVTGNHFAFLGIQPLVGRLLQPADDAPGAEPVVVLSHRLWQAEFGGDPTIVGRPLMVRGLPFTIAGVAPPTFTGAIPLMVPEIWLPVTHAEEVEPAGIIDVVPSPTGRTQLERRGRRWLFVKGRLLDGATMEQARAQIPVLGVQLAAAHPETNRDRRMAAFATRDVPFLVPQSAAALSTGATGVMAVVGLVLLIACANVAGMLLARASSRTREISLRLAIGASRGQIVRQMLAEGLVLGSGGAVVAGVLAWAMLRLVLSIPLPLPAAVALDVPLDTRAFVFALVIALVAGVLASLAPALKSSSMRLAGDLRGAVAAVRVGGRRVALGDALVVGQLALTFVLTVIAGLLLRSLWVSQSADVGFRTAGLAMVSADPGMVRYPAERTRQFWTDALARVRQLPGVTGAALATPRVPFDVNHSQTTLAIDGRSYPPDSRGNSIANVAVSPEYFSLLDIPIVAGRAISDADRPGAPLVAVVNETMARRFWPDGDAVGRTFRLPLRGGQQVEVVGVARDHRVFAVAERPTPYVHFAAAQQPSDYNYLIARTSSDAGALVAAMRRELLRLEPGLVFLASSTMTTTMAASLLPQRLAALLAAGFGGVGLLLAAVGLYGAIAYSVARRTREIGVRLAVGAAAGGVLALVMRQGMTLAVVGLVIGGSLAAVAATLLEGALYGVGTGDVVAWGGAAAGLLLAAALANFVPARRAMRVDPVTALRAE